VLQCAALCCSALEYVALFGSVSQCVAVSCSAFEELTAACADQTRLLYFGTCGALCCIVLQWAALCCSMLQCVAVYGSVLQCVAVSCSAFEMLTAACTNQTRLLYFGTCIVVC